MQFESKKQTGTPVCRTISGQSSAFLRYYLPLTDLCKNRMYRKN